MPLTKEKLEKLRRDYGSAKLLESELSNNPMDLFEKWFTEALEAEVYEPNAMTLATVRHDRKPAARIVLLKGFEAERGFIFYTNYLSAKGQELAQNPEAALVLYWAELARQVRIEGTIEKISQEESTAYFHSRPRGSQIGAVISPQSQVLTSPNQLELLKQKVEDSYQNKTIPKPVHWGGYLVKPCLIEFWQGRTDRLHDRIVYKKASAERWEMNRLAP